MKAHQSSDAYSCGLSKAVQNSIIYIYYLGQMQCFRKKSQSSDSVNTCKEGIKCIYYLKIVSEYDQEVPQLQTADKPMEEPHNHQETTGRQTKQSKQLSLPHQDDCKTRMEIK